MNRRQTPDIMAELTLAKPDKPHQEGTTTIHTNTSEPESIPLTQKIKPPLPGRKSPQICCKVTPEDAAFLNELTVLATNKLGKSVNTSTVIRSLIQLGRENKDKLDFNER